MLRKKRKIKNPLMCKFEICEIIRKIYPASDEVIEVYEKGKPRLVSIDILKELKGDSNVHIPLVLINNSLEKNICFS